MKDPRARLGREAEELVARMLRERGLEVLDRNVRNRLGELDIVALDGDVVCFVEVRSRSTARYGSPAESVTADKQRRLRQAAAEYLRQRRLSGPARFDVASVLWSPRAEVEYFPNAFE